MRRQKLLVLTLAAVLAASVGCAKKPSDDAIANNIKARFFSDPDLKTTNVGAAVKNGQVTLTGNVTTPDVELKAMKLANGEPGVNKVEDQLKAQPAPAAQVTPDAGSPNAAPAPATRKLSALGAERKEQRQVKVVSPSNPPGLGQQASKEERAKAAPAAPQPVVVTIPAGTPLSIRMIDSVDSSCNQTGQEFKASLDDPISLQGYGTIPRGTDIVVRLAVARNAGRIKGQSELERQLVRAVFQGKDYSLISDVYEQKGKARGKQTATRTGIGAAAGAIIGALTGGGKGAAIGAAVGGGGATAYQVFTHRQQIRIPSETRMQFQLQAPAKVTMMPGQGRR